ncbi:major facilitator superfamily domain-containing protein 6-like [Argiope bruennichi]|uniref:major facilitator superfamily domain-containing protein 6-like n=1 Tax=Argiope bruennichi TaxID=94029 RepID=UPI00249418E6|nr:major facilitator superfamily domain-containing protein 6-like [Argiope bruennichi]XP_055937688.1 major facilitator superfamily domain-containing protein 6-like [Argiope bruennichi]
MGFLKIDKLLLPLKIHYFLFMAALACALPFRTVFAKQLGISATAVGVIFLAIPFFKILTNPLFGLLVDHFKKFRLTISVLMLIVAVTHVIMVFIPPLKTSEDLTHNTQNLQSTVEYVCSSHDNRPYINIYNEFQTESDGNSPHVSCEVTCQKASWQISELTEEYGSCDKNISGVFRVNFKISNYRFEFSLANDSYIIAQNSTKKLSSVNEEKFKSWHRSKKVGCSGKQNCFSNKDRNLTREDFNKTNSLKSPELSLHSNQESNFTLSSNGDDTKQHYTFIAENLYMIQSLYNYSDCLCEQRLNCSTTKCNYIIDQKELDSEDEFLSYQFWSLFFLIAISSTFFCAVLFLIDAMCYEMLSNSKEDYGLQRLWGTIGWGLGALAGGYLNHLISPDSTNIDYSLSFYLLGVLTIIDLLPVYKLQIGEVKYSPNICKDIWSLLSKLDIAINIFIVFTIGVLSGLLWNYQFWFMEEIGASQVLLGLSQTFECVAAEVPCFLISGWVIRKIGYINCNSLTLFCFGLRYLCFAFMWDPWMTLPVGFFNGPCFGIFFAAMTMYGKTEAPPGTEATVQSLLAMSFEGVGAGMGSILGGIGFDKFGSRKTFLISAIVSFVLFVINVLLHIFVLRRRAEKPPVKSKSTPKGSTTNF